MKLKRFLVFGGSRYYPSGGWEDFKGSFDTLEECTKPKDIDGDIYWTDWWHIVDTEAGQIIKGE